MLRAIKNLLSWPPQQPVQVDTLQIARDAIQQIKNSYPSLKMVENPEEPVELSITIPVQKGVKHKVWLCLQNYDELHFSVGNFWLEWFPCTKKTIAKRFIDSITGYLSGEYRVYEHYRGDACVKAELQKPMNGAWETIGTSVRFRFNPFPWKKTYIEFRNT